MAGEDQAPCTALPKFVRFLSAEVHVWLALQAAILFVPHWRLSSLPRSPHADERETSSRRAIH